MSALQERKIGPSDVSPDILRQLSDVIQEEGRPVLVGHDGERVELPKELNDILLYVVQAMENKRTVFLVPEDESFTTQAAANLLGMSRPYLLRLLAAGKIPFYRVGTHRRVRFGDLRAFQEMRDKERRKNLDDLTQAIDEAGVYDRF